MTDRQRPWELETLAGAMTGALVLMVAFDACLSAMPRRGLLLELGAGVIATHVVPLLVIAVVVRRRIASGQRRRALGLADFDVATVWGAAGRTALILPIVLGVNLACYALSERFFGSVEVNPLVAELWRGPWPHVVAVAVCAVLIAPPAEELVFRLILFNALRRGFGERLATCTTAAIFAAFHLIPEEVLPLFILGCALQRERTRSGGLWKPILIHAFFNGTVVVVALLQRLLAP